MEGATHFIEVYKSNGYYITSSVQDIKDLSKNLEYTASCVDLKTIAVWFIKYK